MTTYPLFRGVFSTCNLYRHFMHRLFHTPGPKGDDLVFRQHCDEKIEANRIARLPKYITTSRSGDFEGDWRSMLNRSK